MPCMAKPLWKKQSIFGSIPSLRLLNPIFFNHIQPSFTYFELQRSIFILPHKSNPWLFLFLEDFFVVAGVTKRADSGFGSSRGNFSQERPFPHGSPSTVVMYMFVVATIFFEIIIVKVSFWPKKYQTTQKPELSNFNRLDLFLHLPAWGS